MRGSGDLAIINISECLTPKGSAARRGASMADIETIPDAVILIRNGLIAYAGPASGISAASFAGMPILDSGGRPAIPGFVDSHTHFIFAGYRAEEFYWRAGGIPYMEIHKRGGGIRRSVDATRAASLEELVALGKKRLSAMTASGITTVEGKSGYGLDLGTELRQLEAMRALGDDPSVAVDIVPTFLGPHSTPPEFAGNPSAYIDYVIATVLPEVSARKAAVFCDIFCEKNVFELEDSRRYLEAARSLGFRLKLHADEIERIGGAGLAAEMAATSADHLLKASMEDLEAMARAGVIATCLPLTAFTLREPYADARGMIDAGLALALASDLNPGSCFSQSIPLIFALGVLYMKLLPEEILTALTLNGAAALGLAGKTGSIEAGKQGDIVLLDAPSWKHLAYNVGANPVSCVVKNGIPVWGS